MKISRKIVLPGILSAALLSGCSDNHTLDISIDEVKSVCDTVVSWQLANFDRVPLNAEAYIANYQVHWSAGVLYTGLFEWAEYSEDERIFDFLKGIGEANDWGLWERRTPYHADDICIGQMYIKMAQRFKAPQMMAATVERARFCAGNPATDPLSKKDDIGKYSRWSWCDALFMAPPVYAALYRMTGENFFFDYMDKEFRECTDSLFDRTEKLYFRDNIRRENREPNGAKEFWGRGNSWVFAGIALTLESLEPAHPARKYYEGIFKEMAATVIRVQGEDGSWRASLLAPEHFPTPENSSSALFCYGLAWGLRHGLLDWKTYAPCLEKGWKALVSYVQPSGKLGFVQPIGAFPLGGITEENTQLYAVGGLLLAGTEISRLLTKEGEDKEVNHKVSQASFDGFEFIGVLKNKNLCETHNDLTIGCETIDRDYADYHMYKTYLDELGARKIRLQAGWAKTEKEKGVYDFGWLDSIVDDAVSRGLIPWIETAYGNPIYEGGGTPFLAGGWPTSEEALNAWDNWVRAMAERYKGKGVEWEIWNEPDIHDELFKDGREFVELTIRTAKIIRSVEPDAKIAGFAWAFCRPELFDNCMRILKEENALGLLDWITYHFYRYRPEDVTLAGMELQKVLDRYDTSIILRQGETGCPSQGNLGGALSENDWTEVSQAKWNLRRMVTDKGHGIPTTAFTISDFTYSKQDYVTRKNVKGLLETDENLVVTRPKEAYYAYRNLATVWDETDTPLPQAGICVESEESHSVYAFRDNETGLESFMIWNDSKIPGEGLTASPVNVKTGGLNIPDPVCVDLRTGNVYKLASTGSIPVYDSPVLVTDRRLVTLK